MYHGTGKVLSLFIFRIPRSSLSFEEENHIFTNLAVLWVMVRVYDYHIDKKNIFDHQLRTIMTTIKFLNIFSQLCEHEIILTVLIWIACAM